MILAGGETPHSASSNGCLYVALSRDHRVSRTFRAAWFLSHLNRTLGHLSEQEEDESKDIKLHGARGVSGGVVTPGTDVLYVCWHYSLVFVLDFSPNMRSVSNSNYLVKVDEAVSSLCQCLSLLTQPFAIEDGSERVEPRLCVTVFAFSGSSSDEPVHVLVQGRYVSHEDCQDMLVSLQEDIRSYENSLAQHETTGLATPPLVPGDTSVEAMLRAGTLAIQLLPRGALKGLVLLTDGLSGFSSPASLLSTVTNMRGSNISCWVVHIGGPGHPNAPLGLVPDLETLNFICRACSGCVINPDKLLASTPKEFTEGGMAHPNVLQEAILMWSWQKSAFNNRVKGVVSSEWAEFEDPFTPLKIQQFHGGTIKAPLLGMVGCKIREGFFMDQLHTVDTRLEVRLCYPWKPSVNIYYTIQASWPLSPRPEDLQFTTSYSGPYSFVHDVLSDHASSSITQHRLGAVRKFKQALQRFSSSDAILAHFLSFSTSPSHYSLSHSVQGGLPLFYFPPNSSKPIPSPGINLSGGKSSTLHLYWRPLCTIDTSQWFRWFHTNKIVLVLYPELPLPHNLLQMTNGRYASPLCRPNASHLFDYLKTWSSVVLLEGHSYIRFLPFQAPSPRYFCLVRVAQKHPCVVLHVGHIEGTPHTLQRETAAALRSGLGLLCVTGGDRPVGGSSKSGGAGKSSISKKLPSHTPRVKPILTVLHKQLQRFMIRHELKSHTHSQPGHAQPGGMGLLEPSEHVSQMDYLTGCRYSWLVPLHSPHLATALLRRRLREGFIITSTNQGIVTLVVQLRVQQVDQVGMAGVKEGEGLPFLLQYVIFPYEHGEHLKSELWVEPQHGTIASCPTGLQYLLGLSHTHIANAVHQEDRAVVLETESFVLLQTCCETKAKTVFEEESSKISFKDGPASGCGLHLYDVRVPFQLTSLLDQTCVWAVLLRAMSDGVAADGGVVSLSHCSQLNSHFWHLVQAGVEKEAPTLVPLHQPVAALLHRLRRSGRLHQLFSLAGWESAMEDLQWTCRGLSLEDGGVAVICMPHGFFYRHFPPVLVDPSSPLCHSPFTSSASLSPGSSPPSTLLVEQTPTTTLPRPLWLPVLLLQLDHTHFLEPPTFAPSSTSPVLEGDRCVSLDLGASEEERGLGDNRGCVDDRGCSLVDKMAHVHRTCYMGVVHSALSSQLPLSPQDFHLGLQCCQHTSVTMDTTPLFSALCGHASSTWLDQWEQPGMLLAPHLDVDSLCHLLSASMARREWVVGVTSRDEEEEEEGVESCDQASAAMNCVLLKQLEKLGFQPVLGQEQDHFWLDTRRLDGKKSDGAYSVVPLSQSSSSETSPVHRSAVVSDVVGGDLELSSLTDDDEDGAFDWNVLMSPRSEEDRHREISVPEGKDEATTPPLFLHISLSRCDGHGLELEKLQRPTEASGPLTCCIRKLRGAVTLETVSVRTGARKDTLTNDELTLSGPEVDSTEEGGVTGGGGVSWGGVTVYTVAVNLSLSCFQGGSLEGQSVLPRCYQGVVTSLQQYLHWLLCDELVTMGRSLEGISEPLLQGVCAHVQNSHNLVSTCHMKILPLKFVFGENHSLSHFIQQLQVLDVVGHTLHKIHDYYYLEPNPPSLDSTHQGNLSADLQSNGDLSMLTPGRHPVLPSTSRSRTPPPPPPLLPSASVHRRSLSTGFPGSHAHTLQGHTHTLQGHTSSQLSSQSSSQHDLTEEGSGYEAGLSSGESMLEEKGGRSPVCVVMEGGVWIILRVLAGTVSIYFQVRNSRQLGSEVMQELYEVYEQVFVKVQKTCHRSNQWFLLKDMLEIHSCSPYLLLESGSEAWVEGHQHSRVEPFRPQEFACELVHSNHITLHCRLKEMKPKAALLVTRSALSAFAVTNRIDLYVLQDVTATGEENIFYVKVDESLCSVGKLGQWDSTPSLERRDTVCTVDTTETMSTMSYQQSLSEVQAESDRRGPAPVIEGVGLPLLPLQGKPQESLVLQVYGICQASVDFQERLHGTIQRKLDATTLDILCGLYSRNPQLKLGAEDVVFLQPDFRKPSLTFYLRLPHWMGDSHRKVFFFYLLQNFSSLAFYPLYSSTDSKEHFFHVDMELENTYLANNLNKDALADHLFLYIRPQNKGRGMAVLCPSLLDPAGRGVSPLPGRIAALTVEEEEEVGLCDEEGVWLCGKEGVVSEQVLTDSHGVKIQVWEKGNIGIEEFMQRLELCFRYTMADFFLEACLFPRPIAVVDEEDQLDPGRLVPDQDKGEGQSEEQDATTGQMIHQARPSVDIREVGSPSRRVSETQHGRGSCRTSETPLRRVSETRRDLDFGSDSVSRRGSDNLSYRGSLTPSRRDSDNLSVLTSQSSSRRSSDAFWLSHASSWSRRNSLTHAESRRVSGDRIILEQVSQVLSSWRQEAISEVDESQYAADTSSPCPEGDTPTSSPSPCLGEMGGEGRGGGGLGWLNKEKMRRVVKARRMLQREAELGRCGQLTESYSKTLPRFLKHAYQINCPSVHHLQEALLGHHASLTAVSQLVSSLQPIFPDLTFSSFRFTSRGYLYSLPEKDLTKVQKSVGDILDSKFIVLARNISQWEESHGETSGHTPSGVVMELGRTQRFSSLGGKFMMASSTTSRTPLRGAGNLKNTFVPRRRLVFLQVSHDQLEVWLYNVSDGVVKRIQDRLRGVREWHGARTGLLHCLLAQKMGLFKHCQGPTLASYTKAAQKKCATMNSLVKVIKNIAPVEEAVPVRHPGGLGPGHMTHSERVSIGTVYQEQRPYGGVAHSQDPVFNHGCQFRHWHAVRRRQLESQDLLGRVFASWQARGGDGASIPVDKDSIKSLKRMARLLHYCTSSLLLPSNSSPWVQELQKEVLALYERYLGSIGFQTINERDSMKRKPPSHHRPAPNHLSKVLQRSWPEGIIMAEIFFNDSDFTVRLYTLERSRLQQGVEFSSLFSKKCAGYKDFIHVRSFMHDFHLNVLLKLLTGHRQGPPYPLHLGKFIELCHQHSSPPPNFVNNLLTKGVICVPSPVEPHLLYRHLITQCQEFDATPLELGKGGLSPSTNDELVGLLLDIHANSSLNLAFFTSTVKNGYLVKVLAMFTPRVDQSDEVHLRLVFYLLLVHTKDLFPRLTSSSPSLTASCHPLPANTDNMEPGSRESDLHQEVKEHRRRMGLGSLTTPSASIQQVLEHEQIEQLGHSMKTYLEDVIQNGLHRMRKDELWKRMLYGNSDPAADSKSPAVWSNLSFTDFQDLLYMVTECPLETLDQRLMPFKKQPRKWFKKLISPMKMKFGENVREYVRDNQSYMVVINPDWQDMAVLVRADVDSYRHGGLSAIYRKDKERGSAPELERAITTHLEADRLHIETVVNFCCSFLWATILDSAPPPPTLQFL